MKQAGLEGCEDLIAEREADDDETGGCVTEVPKRISGFFTRRLHAPSSRPPHDEDVFRRYQRAHDDYRQLLGKCQSLAEQHAAALEAVHPQHEKESRLIEIGNFAALGHESGWAIVDGNRILLTNAAFLQLDRGL